MRAMNASNLALFVLLVYLCACAAAPGSAPAPAPAAWPDAAHPVLRVGGDLEARTSAAPGTADGEPTVIYTCGISRVDTPLPVGYPPPTAPGAIELKRYPLVRRAEMRDVRVPELAFYPLLAHIKSRQIAMTSPVEMDYAEGADGLRRETMSFLYRRPDQGPAGTTETPVVVRDLPETCVLSLGVRGGLGAEEIESSLAKLRALIAAHPEWRAAGEPRTLQYNSPFVRYDARWCEVQIPLARAGS